MRCCDCPHKHTNNDDEPDIELVDDKADNDDDRG